MSVPKIGVYQPANKSMKIQIINAVASTGVISGVYENLYTPAGYITAKGPIGNYRWVSNGEGKSGNAPFNIWFTGTIRPADRPYCMTDIWNGVYLKDDTMRLTGSRSYVNDKGELESTCLGTLTFSLMQES